MGIHKILIKIKAYHNRVKFRSQKPGGFYPYHPKPYTSHDKE